MRALWIMPVFAAVLLTGCGDLLSVEGLANKGNTVFDPTLVGAWNSGDAVIIVQAGDDQSYGIHWLGAEGTQTPQIVRMEGRLVKLGEQRMLDLTAADPGAFAIPCHVFLRVRPVKEGLKVQFVDSKWIREQVPGSLASFMQDNHPVLTAPAPQVEAFLLKFGFDERALDDPMLLRPLKQ
ncbi:MAG TPA: hypothetical protein VKG79_12380 [Bryobacteraceae bacterium]|nr:hypothetical protein [Bryobacteraceae bacterium]